jgi:hypothetical protein
VRLRGIRGIDRGEAALLAVVVLAAVVFRAVLLREPMRYDEAFTYLTFAVAPVSYITTSYPLPNNHILYSVLAHYSWALFGDHVWTVRVPAVLAGIAISPVSYITGRRLYDRQAGLWAAGLTATFGELIDFSVAGRGYTLGILLMLVALLMGTLLLERSRLWAWCVFVICSALSVYSVPIMAYAVVTVPAWMAVVVLLRSPRHLRMLVWLAAAVAATAGLSVLLYSGVLHQAGWTASRPLPRDFASVRDLAERTWATWNRGVPHPLDWLIVAGFLTALALHRRIARQPFPIAVVAIGAVVGGLLFTSRVPAHARYWVWLVPFYLITAGAGLSYLTRLVAARLGAPRLTQAAAVLAVTLGLGVAILHAGQGGAEEPPRSDNEIGAFMKHQYANAPGRRILVEQLVSGPAIGYYQARERLPVGAGTRVITDGQRAAGHAWLIVPGHKPSTAVNLATATGGQVVPGSVPRVVRRFKYVTVFDVRLVRPPPARRPHQQSRG